MELLKYKFRSDAFMVCKIAANGQGLLQGWNSLLVRPEPLLIKDIKVQVNKQKPNDVGPAQMKHNSDKMTIASTSGSLAANPMLAEVLAPNDLLVECHL